MTDKPPIAPILWGREKGWLRIKDPNTHEWHEIPASTVDRTWKWMASAAKDAARGRLQVVPPPPIIYDKEDDDDDD